MIGIRARLGAMPRKPPRPRKTSNPEQHKRFIEMAREVEVDERPEAFDRAFRKVIYSKPAKKRSTRQTPAD
jgi:hypothetical protein